MYITYCLILHVPLCIHTYIFMTICLVVTYLLPLNSGCGLLDKCTVKRLLTDSPNIRLTNKSTYMVVPRKFLESLIWMKLGIEVPGICLKFTIQIYGLRIATNYSKIYFACLRMSLIVVLYRRKLKGLIFNKKI